VVAKPLNHWIPLGRLGAPTNPPDIEFPQWGQESIAATERPGGYEPREADSRT
jgi:hypothetical protein